VIWYYNYFNGFCAWINRKRSHFQRRNTTILLPQPKRALRYSDRVNETRQRRFTQYTCGSMRNISTARARMYTKERRVFREERQMIDRRFLGIKRGINVASYRFIEMFLSPYFRHHVEKRCWSRKIAYKKQIMSRVAQVEYKVSVLYKYFLLFFKNM